MPRDLLNRYVWLVDTVRRYGRVTLRELQDLWGRTSFGQDSARRDADGRVVGGALTRRTLYNYRAAAADLFGVEIACDPGTNEYYIANEEPARGGGADRGPHGRSVTDWLLDSAAITDTLAASRDVAGRIYLEDIPSGRRYLGELVTALREHRRVRMDYGYFQRSVPRRGVVLEPYFLKLFRQRWYITGLNVGDRRIRTYSLDRIQALELMRETFQEPPGGFDADGYVRDSFGIVFEQGEACRVSVRADAVTAKYLRALPLHHSQRETATHEAFADFTLRVRLTPDLVQELMSLGPGVEVLAPESLRRMLRERLAQTLEKYPLEGEEKKG